MGPLKDRPVYLACGATAFTHCLFNLLAVTRTHRKDGGTTCLNRMLRMREAADGLLDGRASPSGKTSGHLLSHSNSFGFEMEKARLAAVPLAVTLL